MKYIRILKGIQDTQKMESGTDKMIPDITDEIWKKGSVFFK